MGAAAVVGVLGAMVSFVAQAEQAKAKNKAERVKRKMVKAKTKAEADLITRRAQRMSSKQISQFAASGVDVGIGAPVALTEETMRLAAEDISYLYTQQGFQLDAISANISAINTSAQWGMAGSLLEGAGYAAEGMSDNG